MTNIDIRHGDCLNALREMPDNSIDSIVTDPPYGLSNTKPQQVAEVLSAWVTGDTEAVPAKRGGFMGAEWDSFVPPPAVWEECLRVLKPGGHMAVFSGARTQDLMGLRIRLAGFEIRESMGWISGTGFPKGQDLGKAVGKMKGAKREAAGRWDGWNTQLKPAIEPIILARKPLVGTVAQNVLEYGVGGLNIDACRVGMSNADREAAKVPQPVQHNDARAVYQAGHGEGRNGTTFEPAPAGRFPANVLLDEHAAAEMDEQSGVLDPGGQSQKGTGRMPDASSYALKRVAGTARYQDRGGAAKFFPVFKYQAKAPKRERPVVEREDGSKIKHPTVKPLALMEWLVTLITPEGGTVLDPFAGTGTTLQAARDKGFSSIGIEQDPEYIQLINARLETEPDE